MPNALPVNKLDRSPDDYAAGNVSITTATNTKIIDGQVGRRMYISTISISNVGATTSLITFTSGEAGATVWHTIAPAGGGSNLLFADQIRVAVGESLWVTTSEASTTIYVSAVGHFGP